MEGGGEEEKGRNKGRWGGWRGGKPQFAECRSVKPSSEGEIDV